MTRIRSSRPEQTLLYRLERTDFARRTITDVRPTQILPYKFITILFSSILEPVEQVIELCVSIPGKGDEAFLRINSNKCSH